MTSVTFSPDGKWLAAGLTQHGRPKTPTFQGAPDHDYYSGGVQVWGATTGQELQWLPDVHHVNGVAFSDDSTRIASACLLGTLKIWDTSTWKELHTCKGHTNDVNSVVFSPDGKRLASTADDSTLRLWDTATGQEVFTFRGPTSKSVAFSPDGQRLAAAGSVLRIWKAARREP